MGQNYHSKSGNVAKRRVFYVPGFDPHPPRRYRELYRTEAAKQSEISGQRIAIKAQQGEGGYSWLIGAETDGKRVQARYDVLVWADLVKQNMSQSIPGTYWQLLRTAWVYISTGALGKLTLLRKGPVIAALYPIVLLLAQLLLGCLFGWIVGGIIASLTSPAWGWGVGLVLMGCVLHLFRKWDSSLFAYYLMHDYAFTARYKGATPPALAERLEEFQEQIANALTRDLDEILIIGHSSGAHLAIEMLAALDRAGKLAEAKGRVSLMTLGQVVPMVSFLPEAKTLRRDLAELSVSPNLFWLDISAPGDGCCFALCDPVAVSGVASKDKRWPLVLSAAFSQTLQTETWERMRRRYFRLHFQYLCAFDKPGDYDFFKITAGPQTLSDRFSHRSPSNSRIDIAVSRYRSIAR